MFKRQTSDVRKVSDSWELPGWRRATSGIQGASCLYSGFASSFKSGQSPMEERCFPVWWHKTQSQGALTLARVFEAAAVLYHFA